MPEELSPESKLYVKEEIEKIRKEVKEEVERVKSKATKTFTTVVIVVGLLTGLGVYGLAVSYIDKAMAEKIGESTIDEITGYKDEAKSLRDEITGIKTDAGRRLSEMEPVQQKHVENLAKVEKKLSEMEQVQQKRLNEIESYLVPAGGIIAWYPGKPDETMKIEIPEGWAICNGLNGTPNLTDKFIFGTNDPRQSGQQGGSETHTHTADEKIGDIVLDNKRIHNARLHGHPNIGGSEHIHNINISVESSLPPYLKMVYIMKL